MEYTVNVDKYGTVRYYKPGTKVLHREDGPAFVQPCGYKAWFREGKYHREDGPAVEFTNGYKAWYKEGKRHREDGPAIELSDGSESWYIDGKFHREDRPVIVQADGTKKWFIEGKKLSEEEFENRTKEAKVRTFTVPANTTQIRIQLE